MPSETSIIRGGLADDKVPPKVISTELKDSSKVTFYIKELKNVITLNLEDKFNNHKTLQQRNTTIDRLNIVYNAEHGGNHFRVIMKCSLHYHDGANKKVISFKHRIGQMLCRKHTYDLISQTIGPEMKSCLNKLLFDFKKHQILRMSIWITPN